MSEKMRSMIRNPRQHTFGKTAYRAKEGGEKAQKTKKRKRKGKKRKKKKQKIKIKKNSPPEKLLEEVVGQYVPRDPTEGKRQIGTGVRQDSNIGREGNRARSR